MAYIFGPNLSRGRLWRTRLEGVAAPIANLEAVA